MKGNYTEFFSVFGELLTVEEFLQNVQVKALTDRDGDGRPVKGKKMDLKRVYPSQVEDIPSDATHILWFDKYN